MRPSLHHLDVGRGRALQLNGDVGLEPQHIGRAHRAGEIHPQLRIGALEFDQPRPEPEGAERLGDAEPDFAAHFGQRAIASAHQSERGLLHLFRGQQDLGALRRGPDTVDMAGDENGAERALEVLDLAAQRVGRKPERLGGRAEAAVANQFKEGANRFPVGCGCTGAGMGLQRTTPIRNRMHTCPYHRS